MADSSLNAFVAQGTTTQRNAFTPNPPTPASIGSMGIFWWDHTLQQMFAWDIVGTAWVAVAPIAGSGVSGSGLTANVPIVGNGSSAIKIAPTGSVLPVLTTTTITNAAMLTLPTTPVSLVATPGAGFRTVLLTATLRAALTSVYTNVDAGAYLYIGNGVNTASGFLANDTTTTPALTDATALLHVNALSCVQFEPFTQAPDPASNGWGTAASTQAFDFANQAFNLIMSNGGSGNLTGGNAANSVVVRTLTITVPVP